MADVRVEVDSHGPVRERLLQRDAHQTVRTTRHPLLRHRGAEDVLEECFAARLVEASFAELNGETKAKTPDTKSE